MDGRPQPAKLDFVDLRPAVVFSTCPLYVCVCGNRFRLMLLYAAWCFCLCVLESGFLDLVSQSCVGLTRALFRLFFLHFHSRERT